MIPSHRVAAILVLHLSGFFGAVACGAPPQQNDAERLASSFVAALAKGDFVQAERDFGPQMRAAVTANTLKGTWDAVIVASGPFKEITQQRTKVGKESEVVQLTLRFEKATVEVRVVVNLPTESPRQIVGISGLSAPRAVGGNLGTGRSEAVTKSAIGFVTALQRGDFSAACVDFNPEMRKALPPEGLEATWLSTTHQFGMLQEVLRTRAVREGEYDAVYVTSRFETSAIDIKVVFKSADPRPQIVGLFFKPLQ